MSRPRVSPGVVVAFTDVMCGWSTVAFHRFYQARAAAGLEDRLVLDPQLFLLEDVNQMALNMKMIEGEKPVVGALAEELEFKPWQRDPSEYPVSSLLANEAVHAAKAQSPQAAEQLDMALRLGFWRDSRCLTMLHEILAVAARCDRVDVDRLRDDLDSGRARGPMMATYRDCRDAVQGSPHFFLPDGSDSHNPGIDMHQVGSPGAGFLVLDSDDPGAYDRLVRQATRSEPEKL
jgi:predicted DsbA family dithiol-disulfide isomerase